MAPANPRKVYDLFHQALRHNRREPQTWGPTLQASDGVTASFALELQDGRLSAVSYRATTCITLVALCELLAQQATGLTIAEAQSLDAAWLLQAIPEIPQARQPRAELAAEAFHASLRLHC